MCLIRTSEIQQLKIYNTNRKKRRDRNVTQISTQKLKGHQSTQSWKFLAKCDFEKCEITYFHSRIQQAVSFLNNDDGWWYVMSMMMTLITFLEHLFSLDKAWHLTSNLLLKKTPTELKWSYQLSDTWSATPTCWITAIRKTESPINMILECVRWKRVVWAT